MKRILLSFALLCIMSVSISYAEVTTIEVPKISITLYDQTFENTALVYPIVMVNGRFYYPLTWDLSNAIGYKPQFSHVNGLNLVDTSTVTIPSRIMGPQISIASYKVVNYVLKINDVKIPTTDRIYNISGITYISENALAFMGKKMTYTHENGLVIHTPKSKTELPKVHNTYDQLDASQLIRNQGTAATCWAFAANSMFEIAIAKRTNTYNDFSESHLIQYTTIPSTVESGGNFHASRIYYQNMFGPVYETSTLTSVDLSPYKLTGYIEINYDLLETKRAIYDYGSVLTAIYLDESDHKVYSKEHSAYFNDSESREKTHELLLVGWDDTYSREYFVTKPKSDGAFIAQNSFGNSWGEGGFFYISYEDVHLLNEVYAITQFSTESVKQTMYAYDETGITHFESFGDSNNAMGINTFKTQGNETLKNIGLYTSEDHMSVEIYYATGRFTQRLSPVKYQIFIEKKGYHIVELPLALQLNDASYFWIGTLFKGSSPFVVPIEAPYPGVTYSITSKAGEGFIGNGEVFYDITLFRKNASIALRAYTWPN